MLCIMLYAWNFCHSPENSVTHGEWNEKAKGQPLRSTNFDAGSFCSQIRKFLNCHHSSFLKCSRSNGGSTVCLQINACSFPLLGGWQLSFHLGWFHLMLEFFMIILSLATNLCCVGQWIIKWKSELLMIVDRSCSNEVSNEILFNASDGPCVTQILWDKSHPQLWKEVSAGLSATNRPWLQTFPLKLWPNAKKVSLTKASMFDLPTFCSLWQQLIVVFVSKSRKQGMVTRSVSAATNTSLSPNCP